MVGDLQRLDQICASLHAGGTHASTTCINLLNDLNGPDHQLPSN